MKHKLSIITVNYNNLKGLEKTVFSVKNQSYKGFEHIIIDGGSVDGSSTFLKQQESLFTYWVSEPDSGVYDAMNKGIERASGDYLLFLNSGDHFIDENALERIHSITKDKDIIYFNLQVIDKGKVYTKKYPGKLSFSYFVQDTLPHPATFIKRELFRTVGKYDTNLEIASDWKFFLDAICSFNVSYKHINETLSTFYFDGMSSFHENKLKILKEKLGVLKTDYALFYQDIEDTLKYKTLISGFQKSRIIKVLVRLGFLNKF